MSKDVIDQKTQQYITDVLFQACKQIEFNVTSIDMLVHGLCVNTSGIQNPVRASNAGFFSELHARTVAKIAEDEIFFSIMERTEVDIVILKTDAGDQFGINKKAIEYPMEKIKKEDVYAANGSIVWYPPTEDLPFLVAACAVNDLVEQRPIGYIITCINPSYFLSIFNNMQLAQHGETFLVDFYGGIMLSGSYDQFLPPESLGFQDFRGQGFRSITYNQENSYVAYREVKGTNWSLVSIMSAGEHDRNLKVLLKSTVMLAIGVILIGILISLFIAKGIANPIMRLIPSLEKIGRGDFTVRVECDANDEVGILTQSINKMVNDIRELIDIAYQAQIMRQQVELKTLRMQISPHFLYNTLDSINWLARSKGAVEVGQMTKALADLMRATISNADFITIQEEIKIIKSYLEIQQIRYGDRLLATVDIQKELLEFYMPKLILQPILENAFVHGIDNKISTGTIRISGVFENDIVVFEVWDDGVGIEDEQIEKIFKEVSGETDDGTHIGIKNVDKRLKIYYGNEYGVTIKSQVNAGTSVKISLPKQEKARNVLSNASK